MSELYEEHLEYAEGVQHKRVSQLEEFDHRPEYTDVRLVPSESSDKVYVVSKVETLTEPFDADTTDLVSDTTTVIVCSCDDYWYNQTGGFEDGENPVPEWGRCKHCRAAYRTEKHKNDDSQQGLDEL